MSFNTSLLAKKQCNDIGATKYKAPSLKLKTKTPKCISAQITATVKFLKMSQLCPDIDSYLINI